MSGLPVTVCEYLSMGPRKSARKDKKPKTGLRKGQFHHPGLTLNRDIYTLSALEYKVFGFVHWKREWPDSCGDKAVLYRPWPHDSLFSDFVGVEPYYYEESPSGARPLWLRSLHSDCGSISCLLWVRLFAGAT